MRKDSVHQEAVTIKQKCSKYIKQTLTVLKVEITSSTIIVGDFNTPLSIMDRISCKKINKERTSTTLRQIGPHRHIYI